MTRTRNSLKSTLQFWLIAFTLILVTSCTALAQETPRKDKPTASDGAQGHGIGSGVNEQAPSDARVPPTAVSRARQNKPLWIISKPKGEYTSAAREKGITGEVVLRAEFLTDGTIGEIKVVKGLPHGLTDQAVAAARKMRFEPAKKNARPIKTVRNVSYYFFIY